MKMVLTFKKGGGISFDSDADGTVELAGSGPQGYQFKIDGVIDTTIHSGTVGSITLDIGEDRPRALSTPPAPAPYSPPAPSTPPPSSSPRSGGLGI